MTHTVYVKRSAFFLHSLEMDPTSWAVALAVSVAIPVESQNIRFPLEDIGQSGAFDFELMLNFGDVGLHALLNLHAQHLWELLHGCCQLRILDAKLAQICHHRIDLQSTGWQSHSSCDVHMQKAL